MRPAILRLCLALCIASAAHGAETPPDLVIRRARIVDGTGRPAFPGDVAVRAGRIAAVGAVAERGSTEIDADGLVLAPGFVDVHTHSEDIFEFPDAENFIRMGVTTLVTGNCGTSRPDIAGFLAELDASNVAVNVATHIGHTTVRQRAMGGSFRRPPTEAELRRMCEMVDQAMRDGAIGLSTGLIYTPGVYATTDEIVALARVAAAHGGIYATHLRHENDRILSALEEMAAIAREAGIQAQVSHLKLSGPSAWGRADRVLASLDKARADGLKIWHDQYVYTASSTGLTRLLPSDALEGGSKQLAVRLGDPAERARIIAEMKNSLARTGRSDYAHVVIANYRKDPSLNGRSLPAAARIRRGSESLDDQIETVFELQLNGGATAIYHNMDEADVRRFLRHPLTMFASDGGPRRPDDGLSHPRSYGNNARVLGRYVREEKLLTLEDAVRRMTSLPAGTHHLGRRGRIEPGAAADLVVFDPATVGDTATFESPHQTARGFRHVVVNGIAVIENGAATGRHPGRPIRRNTSSAASAL